MNSYFVDALRYHEAGLKVIPFWNGTDGKKSFPDGYAKYRTAQSREDVEQLFLGMCSGVCLLCTDGIEAIDIDVKHDPKKTVLQQLRQGVEEFDIPLHGIVQKTKSDGWHIIYRCPAPEGNMKLARRRGEKEAMIETRGNGGLLFIAPTPGYEVISGDLLHIPTVTQEGRDQLVKLCRHLDEPEPVAFTAHLPRESKDLSGLTPWKAFDGKVSVLELLEKHGWKVLRDMGDYIRMNRPGAKHSRGIDATIIKNANLFYPFTSSEQFEPNKAYGPASVYAILEHGGNFSNAARDLYRQGYGDRIDKKAQAAAIKEELPELIKQTESYRFDLSRRLVEPKALLTHIGEKHTQPIGGRGMIGILTGHEKSGKSFVGGCIAASGISGGREQLNLSLDLESGKMLWFDTEQSAYFFNRVQRRIHFMAGAETNVQHYDAFLLRKFSPAQRIEIIEKLIYETPNLTAVMIDGFVDLVADYNNLEAVQEYIQRLMKWSDERQILILGVLHLNKGDGKIRGHIGSEFKNKCDFILNTTKNEAGYTISNPTSRYASIPDIEFTRDEDGLPVYKSAAQRPVSTLYPGPSAQIPAPLYQPMPRYEPESDTPF